MEHNDKTVFYAFILCFYAFAYEEKNRRHSCYVTTSIQQVKAKMQQLHMSLFYNGKLEAYRFRKLKIILGYNNHVCK